MAWMGHDEIRECFASNSKLGRGLDALSHTGSVPTIVVGTRVRVVSGRKFTEFAAGDIGIVVRKDHSSGSCDVAFDGRPLPLPVAQRHLEVVPGTDTPWSPSTDVHDHNRHNDSNVTAATYTRSSPEDGKPWDTPFTLAHGEAAALAEAVSASATATATATATAMAEVTALRLNIKDVRDRLTHEERSRRVGMQEMKLEIDRLRAEHDLRADADCSVKADHQSLVQKQTELFSLCLSLKDEHVDRLSALDGRTESILDRLNVEREEMNLARGHESGEVGVAGSLSVVRSQMEMLSRRVESLSREFSAEAGRLEALHANVAQSLGDQEHREDEMMKRLSLDAERHTASIHGFMAEVEQRTREAVMVGQRASDAIEAHCAAARERDGLLNMLQARVDALADGLGAESRLRSEAVARVESLCQMRDTEDRGSQAREETDQRLQASLADVHRTAEYAESKRREEVGKRLEAEATLHRLQAEFDGVRVQLGRQRQSPQRAQLRLESAEETVPFAMHDVSRMVSGPMREPSPAVTTVQGAVSTSLQGHAEPYLPEAYWASMLRVSSAQGAPPLLPGARTPRTHWPAQPVVVTPGRLVKSASQPLPVASPVCVCGSAFLADAEFCRKCGSKRLLYPRLPDVYAPGPNSIPVDVEEVTSSGTVTPGSRSVIFPA
mmetsp:Transcript_36501/g.97192  ORF Transcript_36501/g.97192 Transcript_36501/m.97192 type:complete len:666 (-) Transcript_36501:32-2029(-)